MAHYLMYPDIYGEKLAFVTEDDLWLYDGNLKRITEGIGIVRYPRFVLDGKSIIFSVFKSMGREDIKPQGDLYIFNINENSIKRLTYFGSRNIKPITSYSGKIYFSSSHSSPLNYYQELYKMSPDGSEIERLGYGNANYIGFGNNFILLGRNIGDPASWKRYRGGTAGQLWLSKDGKTFERILSNLKGNIGSPMIFENNICFISDHEGIGRIYCYDGKDIKKITENVEYYARNANSDGKKIIFQMAGDLYIFDNKLKKLDINVYGSKRGLEDRYIDIGERIEHYSLDEKGESILFTARGKYYKMGTFEGPVIISDDIRLIKGKFLRDGKYIGIQNKNGNESIVIIDSGKIIKKFEGDYGLIYHIWPSPDGKKAAFSNGRQELFILDMENSKINKIDKANVEPIEDLDFSPDSKWVAYSIGINNTRKKIRIRNIETNEYSDIEGTYRIDFSPSFDPLGRYLYFISISSYKAIMDPESPSLTFPNYSKIYLVTLKNSIKSPFVDNLDQEQKEFGIDLDNISQRVVPVPLMEGRYSSLSSVKEGFIYFSMPLNINEENVGEIHYYNIENKKDEIIVERANDYSISLNKTKILYRYRNMYRVIDYSQKQEMKSMNPGKESGIIDLNRIKAWVNPGKEFRQMLYEAWMMMRENYWRDNGIQWDRIFKKYEILLEKISTRAELSDLIWELQGELGTSHSYEYLGDYFNSPLESRGYLGAELEFNNGYRIKKIYKGRLDEKSPLLLPGTDIKENDLIVEINGVELDKNNPPGKLLTNLPSDVVSIKIRRDDKDLIFNVKTVGDESSIIYRDWVEKNKNYVHEKTNGKVGYIHIPDMMEFGFSEFHKNFLEEIEKDALIVDVRYNRGGYVSPFLLEKLNRKIIGYDNPRHGLKIEYPPYSPKGPLICITNELAGSDGDIFSHSFKLMKIGKLIGKRTWGGVIGINPRRRLLDGSVVTQPEYAFWFKDVGFGVENYGTDPDIEIDIAPHDYLSGKDTQLDKAIEMVMKELEQFHRELPP
ncbi:MAG: S41 family peptidase [Thermoplasmata archaeon]|nr:S41 family peptidase [Thermoplasmata archaeon]